MLTLLEAPADFVSLQEAKDHLKSPTRDDDLVQSQIRAAISFLDGPSGYLGAAIASQKWRWQIGAFSSVMRIPLGPLLSVESVSYRNTGGTATVVNPTDYYPFADIEGPYLKPVSDWPSDAEDRDDAVTVDFTAGRAVIPPQLKSAALLIVGQLYLHREIDVDTRIFPTSFAMYDLARPYRARVGV